MGSEVLYFGYASNLLADRMAHIVPNPRRVAVAKLQDFELVFGVFSPKWGGHFAQGIQSTGKAIWGQIYGISAAEFEAIKIQESVDKGIYKAGQFEVTTNKGETVQVYAIYRSEPLLEPGKPSPQYKKVIVDGAIECGLPGDYISWLKDIPDNGYQGDVDYKKIKTNFD